MEWTYCLECGAPQFPGDVDCPQCRVSADPGEAEALEVPTSPTMDWVGVLQSIWIAQLMAAAGGLLLALIVGFGLGYASRVLNRPISADSTRPASHAKVQVAAAAAPAERANTGTPPAAIPPVEPSGPGLPETTSAEPVELVGPPRPPIGPPAELADGAWELEGVRPPPEHWLRLRFPDARSDSPRLPVYEPMSPSVQLYGRYLPGPSSVEIQWQITTPQEWQGAMLSPPIE